MINPPLVSILIANYNNGQYLRETINSILDQAYTDWEIVIVDDCSTDNSIEIYKELKEEGRIKIFYNDKNSGVGYTKKKCIELAEGSICGFVDPDDTLTPDAIKKMIDLHLLNTDCSLVHSKFNICDEYMNKLSVFEHGRNIPPFQDKFFNLDGEISHFCTFKKEFYQQTEGLNPFLKRAVDQDLYIKLYEVGKTLFIDEVLYNYRIHKGGISTNTNAQKAYYWNWLVIFNAIQRRRINFEDDFCQYVVPKNEYGRLLEEYRKLYKYRKINKAIDKIKSLFS